MIRHVSTIALTLGILLATAQAADVNLTDAIDLGSRRELFVDRLLIDRLDGAELRLHRPVDRGHALEFDKPWEGPFSAYVTILHDGERYQAYYRGLSSAALKDGGDDEVVCYAESPDGIAWTKPQLDLFPRAGHAQTNIILANVAPDAHNFSPLIDTRPGVAAQEKYKAIGGYHKTGLSAYVSGDGIHWKKLRADPVFTRQQAGFEEGSKGWVFDSQNVAFWSPHEQKYLLYYRVYRDGVRRIARVESDDFVKWKNPALMEYRHDGAPAPMEQLYTSQTHPYFRAPHLYIATAARFMPGRRVLTTRQAEAINVDPKYFNDTSDAVLLSSRGSNVYDRTFMEALVAPGIGAENWTSRTNYPALNIVPTGRHEMSLYVNQNYGQPTAHLRRYTLRTDGFASVHAGYDGGEMVTRLLKFEGATLSVNFATSAAGGIRAELQDESGQPIEGFAADDCQELIGNEIERPVTWKGGSLSKLAGKSVRLRFVLKDADLYAIRFGDW